jgi:hypothetical protein
MISKVECVNIEKSQDIEVLLSKSNWEPYPIDVFKNINKYSTEINIDRDLPIECRGKYRYVER